MTSDQSATIKALRQQLDEANEAIRQLVAENENLRAAKVIRVVNSDESVDHVC